MSKVAHCHEPGLLLVFIQPKSPAYLDEFHDWYNSEHGPLRMKLDFVQTGYRYKSAANVKPAVWAGMYDLARVSAVAEPSYTNLRKFRSSREQEVMKNKLDVLERKIYKRISVRGCNDKPAASILTVTFVVRDELVGEVHRWYEEEHIDDLSRIPGWRRSRRFQAIGGDGTSPGCTELLAVHEFDEVNGLGGPDHMQARSKPWRNQIVAMVESRRNEQFDFYHEFRAEDYRAPPDMTSPTASRYKPGYFERRSSLAGTETLLASETSIMNVSQATLPQQGVC